MLGKLWTVARQPDRLVPHLQPTERLRKWLSFSFLSLFFLSLGPSWMQSLCVLGNSLLRRMQMKWKAAPIHGRGPPTNINFRLVRRLLRGPLLFTQRGKKRVMASQRAEEPPLLERRWTESDGLVCIIGHRCPNGSVFGRVDPRRPTIWIKQDDE